MWPLEVPSDSRGTWGRSCRLIVVICFEDHIAHTDISIRENNYVTSLHSMCRGSQIPHIISCYLFVSYSTCLKWGSVAAV